VDEIKRDTDNIFTLALNASIVSSKYSSKSSVFDILANKLNEMSNFISQNLENIVKVVKPITEGIQNLISDNDNVLNDVERGNELFSELPTIIQKQRDTVDLLMVKSTESSTQLHNQSLMLPEMYTKVEIMNSDAAGAVEGTVTVRKFAENLLGEVNKILEYRKYSLETKPQIKAIQEKAGSIWQTASRVNEKSRTQLEFTNDAIKFADSVILESDTLKETARIFNQTSEQNSRVTRQVSDKIVYLNQQLKDLETKINTATAMIQKFNADYKQIDNIIEFLKNILKSMHLIGMYSRIESSRDTVVFEGFMNISANISSLQKEIQNNIPNIEKNINETHALINSVSGLFARVTTDFSLIADGSQKIIENLSVIIAISNESENISQIILSDTKLLDDKLANLQGHFNKLPDITKVPVDGSAANIQRGQRMEHICQSVFNAL
jgi:hypothetical protein